MIYVVIVGAVTRRRYYAESRERERQAAELQASLADARLQALRAQINPHVLFNTLNAVSVLALKGDTRRRRAGREPPGRLPAPASTSAAARRAARRGAAVVESYLEIQQTASPIGSSWSTTSTPTVLDALVPTMVLQPLVENAITHGVTTAAAGGRVRIAARREAMRWP